MVALTRKERDRRLRESDILKAAECVFASNGYHLTTIQDIAKEAQYAVGTIYLYFKDKQSLYLDLIERKVEDLISRVKNEVSKTEDVKEKIRVLVREQLSYFEENQDFFRIYFAERGDLRWMIKDKISKSAVDKFIRYLSYITDILKVAQKKCVIRRGLDPKKLAYIFASMLNAVIIPWLKEARDEEKITGMTDFILDVFLKGVEQKP